MSRRLDAPAIPAFQPASRRPSVPPRHRVQPGGSAVETGNLKREVVSDCSLLRIRQRPGGPDPIRRLQPAVCKSHSGCTQPVPRQAPGRSRPGGVPAAVPVPFASFCFSPGRTGCLPVNIFTRWIRVPARSFSTQIVWIAHRMEQRRAGQSSPNRGGASGPARRLRPSPGFRRGCLSWRPRHSLMSGPVW